MEKIYVTQGEHMEFYFGWNVATLNEAMSIVFVHYIAL